jgi:hypothetical protein
MRRGCLALSGATDTGKLRLLPDELAVQLFGPEQGLPGKWATYGTHGDGSCLYHSIAAAIGRLSPSEKRLYSELPAREQKAIVHRWRCTMRDSFTDDQHSKLAGKMRGTATPTAPEVRRKLCLSHEWADEIMIRHASDILDANLMFVDCMTGKLYCNVHGDRPQDQPTILIAWIAHRHFEPIVRVVAGAPGGKGSGRFRGVLLPGKYPEDRVAVGELLRYHNLYCNV